VSSIKVMAVLSVVATLCLAAVVALQLIEMRDYGAPPTVWPVLPE